MFSLLIILIASRGSARQDLDHGNPTSGTNGQFPSLTMNNKGWVIQAYQEEKAANLPLRYKVGYLHNNQIHWSNHYAIYSKGGFPRIAMNDDFVVVTVFAHQITKQLCLRIGKLQVDEEESQSLNSPPANNSDVYNPYLSSPLVKEFSDSSAQQQLQDEMFTNEDMINSASIEWWGEKIMFAEGQNPSVSISKNNIVIIVYEEGDFNVQTSKYRIGKIESKELKWLDDNENG